MKKEAGATRQEDAHERVGPVRRTGPRPVNAVISAIKILRHLNSAGRAEGATEIARATGMYPGTCYQVLQTLVTDDLVLFDPETKTYRPSAGLRSLATGGRDIGDAESPRRRQILDELSARYGATIYFIARVQGEKGILVDFAHPDYHRSYPIILSWDSLHVGAIGRLHVALQTPNPRKLRAIYDAMRWHDKPSFSSWILDVESVRRLGYAVDRGNVTEGLTVVAVPIFDLLGDLSYFLAALYREPATNEERAADVGHGLRVAAENIRHELGLHALSAPNV